MRPCSIALAVLVPLAIGAMAVPVLAQSDAGSRDDNYFAVKLVLGVAGRVGASDPNRNSPSSHVAGPTFGGGLAYMVPLQRYFVLGVDVEQLALHAGVWF